MQTILTKLTLEIEITSLDIVNVDAELLIELLIYLLVVEKHISAISMNCDNQIVIVKANNSKDNMKSTRQIKRQLKYVRKLRNSRVIVLDYAHMSRIWHTNLERNYHVM
jgi:hypothetical protein